MGHNAHTERTLKQLLHKIHELLPGVEVPGLDLSPQPLVELVAGHGLQDVGRDLELGDKSFLLSLGLGLLLLRNVSLPLY